MIFCIYFLFIFSVKIQNDKNCVTNMKMLRTTALQVQPDTNKAQDRGLGVQVVEQR